MTGTKKSLKGFLGVYESAYESADGHSSKLIVKDNLPEEPTDDLLEVVFRDGQIVKEVDFLEIRDRVKSSL